MTADHYRTQRDFEAQLAVGDHCIIRWTNSHRFYVMPAIVAKINPKSVLAALAGTVRDLHGRILYPEGHVIKAPRLSDWKAWSANNCVQPQED